MKKDSSVVFFRFCLMLGDSLAIIASFLFAYLIRTKIDSRPYYFVSDPLKFTFSVAVMVPVWLIILAILGLYNKKIFLGHSRWHETSRLLAASVIGVMFLISFDFFLEGDLFPVRLIAFYAMVICFFSLTIVRFFLKVIRRIILQQRIGSLRAIIIGNTKATSRLISQMLDYPEEGYRVVGVVAGNQFIPKEYRKKLQYSSLKEALKKCEADVIFQTDEKQTEYVYRQSINHHLHYYFTPSETTLSTSMGELELIGSTPVIMVKVTPLVGSAKVAKRLMDLILGTLLLLLASPVMLIIWLLIKLSTPSAHAIYSEIRLSRFNQKVKIHKFRSMKINYCGMSPEAAFHKMEQEGKIKDAERLSKEYRDNGDFLEHDPRITKIGRFIRATSLDELPQLINVVKGDISLVGPRALVPGELRNYGDRSLLLTVKSGLTGLAQVSGRRSISFDERRALDLYYIQNWSVLFDLQIILRTIKAVLIRKGAK